MNEKLKALQTALNGAEKIALELAAQFPACPSAASLRGGIHANLETLDGLDREITALAKPETATKTTTAAAAK